METKTTLKLIEDADSLLEMNDNIIVIGARQHNLKNVSLKIKKGTFCVFTGCSGSGKSSLVFDTIYSEAHKRYMNSMSPYARQFLGVMEKADVDRISGLCPAISIDQKTSSRNPRSTVGTVTEIYDYMRVFFARVGIPYSPATGMPIKSYSVSEMINAALTLPQKTKLQILSPVIRGQKGEYKKMLIQLRRQGFKRAILDGKKIDLETLFDLDKNKKHDLSIVVDRIQIGPESKKRIESSIETAAQLSDGLVSFDIVQLGDADMPQDEKFKIAGQDVKTGSCITLSQKFCCPVSGFSIPNLEPRMFSFNSPYGTCQECNGIGIEYYFVPELIVPDDSISIRDGAIIPFKSSANGKVQMAILENLAKHYKFSLDVPFKELSEDAKDIIFNGNNDEKIQMSIPDGVRTVRVSRSFEGVLGILYAKWNEFEGTQYREELEKYQDCTKCYVCKGHRIREESLLVKINNKNIGDVCTMTIADCLEWFKNVNEGLTENQKIIAKQLVKEIQKRLSFLVNVGLYYLTLSRESATLSGGEFQRIRLASQIGSELTGVIYILDEPSVGLHPSDNDKLIGTLKSLRDMGNTVIVVEHDEAMMMNADYLYDIGPGAGVHGGNLIAEGTPQQICDNPESITGRFLSGKEIVWEAKNTRVINPEHCISINNARMNNLKNISVKIPLQALTLVTGVSGCGKSTLIMQTFYKSIQKKLHLSESTNQYFDSITGMEYIDKVIKIDQSSIGRTPRSNPATYTGCFNYIRDFFAALPESRRRGYKSSRFSFNVKGGRCEKCNGDGIVKIEMYLLSDVYVECDECQGNRYNAETLEIKYKGYSIFNILDMTINEVLKLFANVPGISDKLQSLADVGLGYMKLGQSATTLSGGECQRVKLAKELSKKGTSNTLYILDEPTTGLHSSDIRKLLQILHRLVDQGNTMIIVEHNVDVIKTADYVIDMGPKGGRDGGEVVFAGTPEGLADCKESLTAKYLFPHS